VVITELGSSPPNSVTTNKDGTYLLQLQKPDVYDLMAEKPGWNSAILAVDSMFSSVSKVRVFEMYRSAEEAVVFKEDFGVSYDVSLGTVSLMVAGPDGPGVGVGLEIDTAHGGVYSLEASGDYAPGSSVPKGATEGIVTFVLAKPGTATLTVTAPEGWTCTARAKVPIMANVHTTSFVVCKN